MYKLLAIDLDDTTINSERKITQTVKQAIKKAQQAGVKVMVATGRGYRGTMAILDELELTGPTICFAGAEIVDHPTGHTVHTDLMSKELVQKTIDFAKRHGVYIQVFQGKDYYFEHPTKYSNRYSEALRFEGIKTDFSDMTLDRVSKTLIIDDDRVQQLYKAAQQELGNICEISISRTSFLEFSGFGVTKGKALAYLAAQMQIPREQIIAVGDNIIDLAMMQYAGMGVAVKNASPEILAAADYICPSNDQDGVAHVVNHFILGE